METKICGKCKQGKPLNEFYINRRDGYQSYCKECKKIGDRKYNKQPKRREFNKQCYEKLKNDGYFNEYQQKPEVKKRNAEQMKKYSQDPRLRIRFLARWFAKGKAIISQGYLPNANCWNIKLKLLNLTLVVIFR